MAATKRINIVPLSVEQIEFLLDVPTGHHIENVIFDPNRRVVHIHLSGDSMSEVPPRSEIPWIEYSTLAQKWRDRRRKHTERPT